MKGPLFGALILAAFLAFMLVGPVALFSFLNSAHAWPMTLPVIALYILGHYDLDARVNRPQVFEARAGIVLVAVTVLVMANLRGFYWEVFPRGRAFLSANRVSANLAFGFAYVIPHGKHLWEAYRRDRYNRKVTSKVTE